MGRIWPGSLAANVSRPGPPAAVYSVMKSVPPATARPSAPIKPPCWPPAEVDVCIWIAIDIQDSWPDSAKTLSLGCMLSCLLYTSDAADDLLCVDLGGRRIIKK